MRKKRQDENTSALGYRTGLAAKERKDRKQDRDEKLLKRAEIQCEPCADNRNYLEFDLLIFRVFFALFVPFCGNSFFAFFRGYPCLCLILAPMGFSPGLVSYLPSGDV
jgi:hypothetical protein